MMEIEVLIEAYTILKQYIPAKDRQEASDNLMSVMIDMLSDEELNEFGTVDNNIKKSIKEYSHEDDLEDEDNSDDNW